MWIPALGIVVAYGFLHNCVIAPHFACQSVDWTNLIITFSIIIGIGGARDVVWQRYAHLNEILQLQQSQKSLINNKLWIPFIGWCLVGGFFNNIVIVPYFYDTTKEIEWSGLLAALGIFLTASGFREYGIYAQKDKSLKNGASTPDTDTNSGVVS